MYVKLELIPPSRFRVKMKCSTQPRIIVAVGVWVELELGLGGTFHLYSERAVFKYNVVYLDTATTRKISHKTNNLKLLFA